MVGPVTGCVVAAAAAGYNLLMMWTISNLCSVGRLPYPVGLPCLAPARNQGRFGLVMGGNGRWRPPKPAIFAAAGMFNPKRTLERMTPAKTADFRGFLRFW
jgi:hypothetical protein